MVEVITSEWFEQSTLHCLSTSLIYNTRMGITVKGQAYASNMCSSATVPNSAC